jgi:flavin reductase (DIM6/NTAB) family NADH-FMN oxidoreductase RutF
MAMNFPAPDIPSLFRQLSLGAYVIGVAHGRRRSAFTAASVMEISYSPLLVLVGVNPEHAAYRLMRGGSSFAVSVLKQADASPLLYSKTGDMDGSSALYPLTFRSPALQ